MNPELLLGIDELTLVLSVDKTEIKHTEEWKEIAENIILEFGHLADLDNIFGAQTRLESTPPKGYTNGYQYGFNPFYFAVAYHPLHPTMGVIVKFSAYAWNVYHTKAKTNIKRFLLSIKSNLYKFRLSRIDFDADYMNWNISVDEIYQNCIDNHFEIQTCDGKRNYSKIDGYESNGIASTFYVGSRKAGTRVYIRIYDKRKEQIDKNGYRLQEALYTTSWVRFEAVFLGKYAHELTEIIMNTDDDKLDDLIANKIAEKYRFYDKDNEEYTCFTKALLEEFKDDFQRLHLGSPRNNELISSLLHIINGSGLFPTMYKCDGIWGDETAKILLEYLYAIYKKEYEPNEDVLYWLSRNRDTMQKQSLKGEIEVLEEIRIHKIKKDGVIDE